MRQHDRLPIIDAFPVIYKGRGLPTGNHKTPEGRYREYMLQQAIVSNYDYFPLWQDMILGGEIAYCSKDTWQLLYDIASGKRISAKRKGGPVKISSSVKLQKDLNIMNAFIKAVKSHEAAHAAAKTILSSGKSSKAVYDHAIEIAAHKCNVSASRVKVALENFGISIKGLK